MIKKLTAFTLLILLLVSLVACSSPSTPSEKTKTEEAPKTETIYTDDGPRVGNISLESFSIYGEYLNNDDYDYLIKNIKDLTGFTLKKGSASDKHVILFNVDSSMDELAYKVQAKDGKLYVSVNDKLYTHNLAKAFIYNLSRTTGQTMGPSYLRLSSFFLDEAINQENVEYICETNKNPFDYALGEEVTFNIRLVSGDTLVSVPMFKIEYIDDEGNNDTKVVAGDVGQITYTHAGLNTPGEAMITVTALDENEKVLDKLSKPNCIASVIYDFDNLTVHIDKPDDFDSFWDNTLSSILAYTPHAIASEVCNECKNDDYDIYSVSIETLSLPAYVHISIPKNAKENSLAIILDCPSAGEPESRNYKANKDAITISINRYSIKNHQSKKYYSDYEKEIGSGFLTNCETVDKSGAYFMDLITRDIQSIMYCENTYNNLWDKKTIIVTGGSMGGFQSAVVSSLYTKVTECKINYPWICDIGANYKSTNIPNGNVHYNKNSKYFDACYFAPRFTGKVTISTGFGDDDCSINTVVALYNSFTNASSKSITGKQTMEHQYDGGSNQSYTKQS